MVGRTEAKAQEKCETFQQLVEPEVGVALRGRMLGNFDLSKLVLSLPGGLEDFANAVVPELQRRGLFRTEYEGRTLRQNLGLARPKNRFA